MNSNAMEHPRRNPLRPYIWGLAAFLLILPGIAMQFTSEVDWNTADFVIFGVMLLVACGIYEAAPRFSGSMAYRLAVGLAVLAGFLIVWINAAVGIIGNESNPANIMFYLIPLVALIASLLARFKAPGMVRAMQITAIAQASTALIAVAMGWGHIWVLTAMFVAIWLTSAHLFNKASQDSH